ncbi:hypothetical protein ACFSBL_07810 [Haloarchaeobius litoreus]|uniref:Uncharacterized protein n=2 Tax=Haloarchaeobius litoreus TaxID=755306 RepID=A0ABD6DH04_9EURY
MNSLPNQPCVEVVATQDKTAFADRRQAVIWEDADFRHNSAEAHVGLSYLYRNYEIGVETTGLYRVTGQIAFTADNDAEYTVHLNCSQESRKIECNTQISGSGNTVHRSITGLFEVPTETAFYLELTNPGPSDSTIKAGPGNTYLAMNRIGEIPA